MEAREQERCDARVLVSCTLCGRLLVIPPVAEPLCPGCRSRRAALLQGVVKKAGKYYPTRWERFGRVGRRAPRDS